MMLIADDRFAALELRWEMLNGIFWDEPDQADRACIAEMKAAVAERDLTLGELVEMRMPYKQRADAASQALWDRMRLQHTTGPHNKLYSVANKSEMRIQIIAMDVDTAQLFAVRAGHVRAAENATVFRYNADYIPALMKDGSALGRAMREGIPAWSKSVGGTS